MLLSEDSYHYQQQAHAITLPLLILLLAAIACLAGCRSDDASVAAPSREATSGDSTAVDTRTYAKGEIEIQGVGGDHINHVSRIRDPYYSSFFHAWHFNLDCFSGTGKGTGAFTIWIEQDTVAQNDSANVHHKTAGSRVIHAFFNPTRRVIDSLEFRCGSYSRKNVDADAPIFDVDNDTLTFRLRDSPYSLQADGSILCELHGEALRQKLLRLTWSHSTYSNNLSLHEYRTATELLPPLRFDTTAFIRIIFR